LILEAVKSSKFFFFGPTGSLFSTGMYFFDILISPTKKKNFEPFIRLTEEEVRKELFDFDEKISFKASELGEGKHKIGAEASASWQKHDYVQASNIKNHAKEIEIKIN